MFRSRRQRDAGLPLEPTLSPNGSHHPLIMVTAERQATIRENLMGEGNFEHSSLKKPSKKWKETVTFILRTQILKRGADIIAIAPSNNQRIK